MVRQQMHDMSVKVADAAAAGSIGAAAWANLSNIHVMIQIAAGVIAIIAGTAAAVFHIYKTFDLRQQRRDRE